MEIATIVGAFCELAIARALMTNPINKLPESPKKYRCRMEVESQEPQDHSGQHDCSYADHGVRREQSKREDDDRREQSGARGQAVETIN